MATVILARHGRSTANTEGVLAGRTKGVHLDELGVAQARAAAERVQGLPLAAVVSSPLERCRETAREIARAQPSPVRVQSERGLLECDYGSWTGRPIKELAKEKLWRTVQDHPAGVCFPDGESMAQMTARAVGSLRSWDARVEQEHGPDAVWMAVSHGDVIKALLADALGLHLDLFQRIVVDPGSLSAVRYTASRPFVLTQNSTAGDLSTLRPPKRRGGRRRGGSASGDAVVGGGAGPSSAPRLAPGPDHT
ncbi:MAG TPA: histidine phosphatase family protein [Nocardioidaceae bacterium]|jgi:probable phosphomutase (TIGR03848 family)|nr:histidine phosphatase family protein [Nocardioidaceae bacterium]